MSEKNEQNIPDTIQFMSSWRGSRECGVVKCEQCGGKKFAIYDGGGTCGCSGGCFPIVCLDCGRQQVLLDDKG